MPFCWFCHALSQISLQLLLPDGERRWMDHHPSAQQIDSDRQNDNTMIGISISSDSTFGMSVSV